MHFLKKLTYYGSSPEHQFWCHDEELGWAHPPNAEGYRTVGISGIHSYIKFDEHGIRVNENNISPQVEKKILVLGDSATAGLEVNNNETYPAVLEKLFYENRYQFKFYNAGVRGYGTDQCLWTLNRLDNILRPDYVIYMFTENDFINNRTIKRAGRVYGKPVLVLKNDGLDLANYPCQRFERGYYSYIGYKDNHPVRIEGGIAFDYNPVMDRVKDWFRKRFILFELLAMKKRQIFRYINNMEAGLDVKVYNIDDVDVILFREILKEMKKVNNNLILTSFTHGEENKYTEILRKIADEIDIIYVDITAYFDKNDVYHHDFNSHWNQKGHRQAAQALYDRLKPVFLSQPQ